MRGEENLSRFSSVTTTLLLLPLKGDEIIRQVVWGFDCVLLWRVSMRKVDVF